MVTGYVVGRIICYISVKFGLKTRIPRTCINFKKMTGHMQRAYSANQLPDLLIDCLHDTLKLLYNSRYFDGNIGGDIINYNLTGLGNRETV